MNLPDILNTLKISQESFKLRILNILQEYSKQQKVIIVLSTYPHTYLEDLRECMYYVSVYRPASEEELRGCLQDLHKRHISLEDVDPDEVTAEVDYYIFREGKVHISEAFEYVNFKFEQLKKDEILAKHPLIYKLLNFPTILQMYTGEDGDVVISQNSVTYLLCQ